MTSFRQIEANRANAFRSTGPKTEAGNRRSRNAVRHGLTAETVVVAQEDIEDYQAFDATITADYDARTAVNAFIESSNGKFRAECLNAHWFISLDDAR
jgi:Integrase core domain